EKELAACRGLLPYRPARTALEEAREAIHATGEESVWPRRLEKAVQAWLVRCIVGNPFRPLAPRPKLITPVAEEIYQGRWDLLPLLGEWLQEHGFWEAGEHCLGPDLQHARGCWVVDWVTGRG